MDLKLNADRFTGDKYVILYNKFRPTPPLEIINQCLNYLGQPKANQVADLGCGTGLSTNAWKSFANKVYGVEPSHEMRAVAKDKFDSENIEYIEGFGNETNLPTGSIDIVTCSQAFHWMEPTSALAEINRILKKDSVLVIYDVIWPPLISYEYERTYNTLFRKVNKLILELGEVIAHRWDKKEHNKNVINSGLFNYVREAYYHKSEPFSKEKYLGIALSQGGLEALTKRGFSEKDTGMELFKQEIAALPDLPQKQMTYCYRVTYAIK